MTKRSNTHEGQVIKLVSVTAVEWRRDSEDQFVPTRAKLDYRFSYDDGVADPGFLKAWGLQGDYRNIVNEGGPVTLDVFDGSLSFEDERILERFISLGVEPEVTAKVAGLRNDPAQNEPIVLKTGTLAALLKYGIGPCEAWAFLLNHGAAKPKSMAVLNPLALDKTRVRTFDPWSGAA